MGGEADGEVGLGGCRFCTSAKFNRLWLLHPEVLDLTGKIGATQILPDSFVKEVPRVLLCLLPPLVKHIEIVLHLGQRTSPLKHRRRRMFKIGVPTKPKP